MIDKWFVLLLAVVLGAVLIEQELHKNREHDLKLMNCEAQNEHTTQRH